MLRTSASPVPSVSLLALLLLSGCGGGGSSSPSSSSGSGGGTTSPSLKGTATVSVAWPARAGKLVPLAANSVVVVLAQGGTFLSQTVPRPAAGGTGTATFTGLAYGAYQVAVRAFPNADGSGVAQGVGYGSLAVTEDQPGSAAVAMASTVATLSISPNPLSLAKGSTATLTASATDASGAIVLLSSGGGSEPLAWTLDSTADATLTPSGATATLKGTHSGSANVGASMVVDDAGHTVSAAPVPATITPINDGTGTVTVS